MEKSMANKPDWTRLGTLQRCEQEYAWRHVRMLTTSGAVSASAHFGQMLHVGVRALYDGKSLDDARQMLLDAWKNSMAGRLMAGVMGGNGTWSCAHCGHGWQGDRDAPHLGCTQGWGKSHCTLPIFDAKKSWLIPKQATAILTAYYGAYLGGNSVSDTGEPIVGSKQPYTCVWNEGYAESATESGLPDRAMRSTADGKLYAMDLKTTGMYISSSWERSFEHSQQVAMQLDILEAELGERVEGFILDAINVRAPAASGTNLVRYGPLVYSDALRAELRQHRQRLHTRANELASAPETALKAPGACVRYNDLCPYFDLCHADPEDREAFVQIKRERGQLEEREWNPKTRDAD